jgi:NDP-hexose 4-ketoreductase
MIVEGRGMLASAFLARGSTINATLFARGVPDSGSVDPAAYARELSSLRAAADAAFERGHPLVYFSSAPVYGRFETAPVVESGEPRPVTPYGRHKLACEALVLAAPGPSLILRLPNVVGPGGHPHQLVPALVRRVMAGRVTVLRGAARDLLDVDDLVTLTTRLIEAGAVSRLAGAGRVINVASGICTPAADLVDEISRLLDREPEIDLVEGGEEQRFSLDRLQGLIGDLGFPPEYVRTVLGRRVPAIAAAASPSTISETVAPAP